MDKTQESQSTQLTVPVTAPTTTTPSTAIDSNPSLSSLVGTIAIHTSESNVEPEDTQWGARFFIQQTTPQLQIQLQLQLQLLLLLQPTPHQQHQHQHPPPPFSTSTKNQS